ncbi:TetR/AcrR family transcriptional regulator [Streptomyces pathocidini]|uniref:TetR/AcrR family transcriptional regulator n=1 Tax=Streptomyces pathocidini TaxID=1650571 RepID=UPI003F4D22B5
MVPTARESLLDAAFAALAGRPWPAVRMVDVAAAARVSRQTLYNEFGSKDGLARALVRREADTYLAGVDRALGAGGGDPGARLAAVADWTVRGARASPLLRAVLTGFWTERLPEPPGAGPPSAYVPAQRRADTAPLSPADLLGLVRDRARAALEPGCPQEEAERLGRVCETAVRLALSHVVAPGAPADLMLTVRELVWPQGRFSGPNPTAGGRSRPRSPA